MSARVAQKSTFGIDIQFATVSKMIERDPSLPARPHD
jgi:hypothetical protein